VNPQKLVKMVNEITAFFEAEPDRAVAMESVIGHLKRFWDPRMRRELVRFVDEQRGEGLKEMALLAVKTHRDKLVPAGNPSPGP
jgi:formate dehydrogenase subunit delta